MNIRLQKLIQIVKLFNPNNVCPFENSNFPKPVIHAKFEIFFGSAINRRTINFHLIPRSSAFYRHHKIFMKIDTFC